MRNTALLFLALLVGAFSQSIIFSEILYDPNSLGSEFFELKNVGTSAVNLQDWRVIGGITVGPIPNPLPLQPGEFAVFASNRTDFNLKYGKIASGAYDGRLDNRGDLLTLVDLGNRVVANFTYSELPPWPQASDNGFSIVPVDPNSNPNPGDPASWRMSTLPGGTPFADDTGPTQPLDPIYRQNLRITELMIRPYRPDDPNTDADDFEFVEIKNAGQTSVPLGGLRFFNAIQAVFPNISLAPGAFFVASPNVTQFPNRYGREPDLAYSGKLSNNGEHFALYDQYGNIVYAVNYTDGAPWYAAATSGIGFSLVPRNPNENPDTNDPQNWRVSTLIGGSVYADDEGPTGEPRAELYNLTITEIMYNPPARGNVSGTEYEFIEIKNVGDTPLDLHEVAFVNGVYFQWRNPATATLAPGKFFVLCSNATEFESKYGQQPTGEYLGQLADEGETIAFMDEKGHVIVSFAYGATDPWPNATANGYSIVPVDVNGNGNPADPSYWRTSLEEGGSPFSDDFDGATTGLPPTTTTTSTSSSSTSSSAGTSATSSSSASTSSAATSTTGGVVSTTSSSSTASVSGAVSVQASMLFVAVCLLALLAFF